MSIVMHRLVVLFLALLTIDTLARAESTCGRFISAPAGVKCGVRGSVARPAQIFDFVARAPYETSAQLLIDCRDACLDRGRVCKSWFINRQTLRCRLFAQTIEQMGFTPGSAASLPHFYSRDCVDGECYTVTKTILTSPDAAYDDQSFQVCPPMSLTFYGNTFQCVYMSTNGVLSFGAPSTAYTNTDWPNYTALPSRSIAVFWDDLVVDGVSARVFPEHELSWNFDRLGPNRKIVFTWKARVTGTTADSWVHVTATFTHGSDRDRIVVEYVHLANTQGQGATVGIQDQPSNRSLKVSFDTAQFSTGNTLIFDTKNNRWDLYTS